MHTWKNKQSRLIDLWGYFLFNKKKKKPTLGLWKSGGRQTLWGLAYQCLITVSGSKLCRTLFMDRQLLWAGPFYTTFSSEDVVAFCCVSVSERWGVKFTGSAKIIPLNYLLSSNVIHSRATAWAVGPGDVQAWVFWGQCGGKERVRWWDILMTSHPSRFIALPK